MNIKKPKLSEPLYHIEIGVRASKTADRLRLSTVGDLLKACTKKGKYIGFSKAQKVSVGVNYEFSRMLKLFGFISSNDHVKKTQNDFLPPNETQLAEIAERLQVSLDTPLSDLSWTNQEIYFLESNSRESRRFDRWYLHWERLDKLTMEQFLLNFIRIDNKGKPVFRTWGYSHKKRDLEQIQAMRRRIETGKWNNPESET
jgi:hypothetical protein